MTYEHTLYIIRASRARNKNRFPRAIRRRAAPLLTRFRWRKTRFSTIVLYYGPDLCAIKIYRVRRFINYQYYAVLGKVIGNFFFFNLEVQLKKAFR